MGCVNPLPWCQDETIKAGPVSKPLEFEGFKIAIV